MDDKLSDEEDEYNSSSDDNNDDEEEDGEEEEEEEETMTTTTMTHELDVEERYNASEARCERGIGGRWIDDDGASVG